eukprot:10463339-Alexandrium_andersonii.AAC.1
MAVSTNVDTHEARLARGHLDGIASGVHRADRFISSVGPPHLASSRGHLGGIASGAHGAEIDSPTIGTPCVEHPR